MGHEEVHCQLCGVSFSIGRVRRRDEPPEAGWDFLGYEPVRTDSGDVIDETCGEDSGCLFFYGEHLAGLGCISQEGYSGFRITREEMAGCQQIIALMRKSPDWNPEPDDQDFELTSNYFLSGVGDGSPDGIPLHIFHPVRHGVRNVLISDTIWTLDEENSMGLPVHPTCFEIFKKISMRRYGFIDVHGLYCWRTLEGSTSRFRDGFRGYDVKSSCAGERWLHQAGCEYLVANPIDIPCFSKSLEHLRLGSDERPLGAFRWSYDDSLEAQYSSPPTSMSRSVSDPFIRLPHEILQMILTHCDSQSLANMRLVTQACRQLRPILFHNLLAKEMPWIWELEDLDVREYDWREVFQRAKTRWMSFKGLRNRRRIWSDIEEILNRVERYRRQGVIRDDGTWPDNFSVPKLTDGPFLVRHLTKQPLDEESNDELLN